MDTHAHTHTACVTSPKIITASVVLDEKDQKHAVKFQQRLPSQTGHRSHDHWSHASASRHCPHTHTQPGCRYGSRRKQAEGEESVFRPSVAARSRARGWTREFKEFCVGKETGPRQRRPCPLYFFFFKLWNAAENEER